MASRASVTARGRGSKGSARGKAASWVDDLARGLSSLPELLRLETISMGSIWGERFHSTPAHELVHVLQGGAQIQLRRRSFPAGSGDTFLIPQGTYHRDIHPEEDPYRVILVLFRWPAGDAVVRGMDPRALVNAPAAAKSHLHFLVKEMESEYLGEAVDVPERMRVILLEIVLALVRYSRRSARRLPEARRLVARERRRRLAAEVREHLLSHYDRNVSLEALAAEHRVSPFHLSRSFSQEFGVSMTDMLAMIRMEQAKELLRREDFSVKEVAARVGYSNGNYFAKVFRRAGGLSPSEYRAMVCRRGG